MTDVAAHGLFQTAATDSWVLATLSNNHAHYVTIFVNSLAHAVETHEDMAVAQKLLRKMVPW